MRLLVLPLLLFAALAWSQDATPPVNPDVKEYTNLFLGMKFTYPKDWEMTQNKKNGDTRFLVPIPGTSARGVVEVASVNFRQAKDQWQITELAWNKSQKRNVDRQWEEEILGVPLLLTKSAYTDKGINKNSETGLIYSLGFHKLMFRITASPEVFADVEHSWRSVLESLRTWDGEMPKPEDPSVKIERTDPAADAAAAAEAAKKKADELPHPQVPHVIKSAAPPKLVKEPVATVIEVGGKKAELHLPSDWKVQAAKDGTYTLSNSAMGLGVTMTIWAEEGNDPAATALLKISGQNLNNFVKVDRRDETLPAPNRAGASVAEIWRSGADAKGPLFSGEASVDGGDFYLILTCRSTSGERWGAERRALESLLDRISVELAAGPPKRL